MKDIKIEQDGLVPLFVRRSIVSRDTLFVEHGHDNILLTREGARELRKALKTCLKETDHG